MFNAFSLVTLTIIGSAVQERKYIHASCVNIGISSLHIDYFICLVNQDKIAFFYPLCRLLFLDFKKAMKESSQRVSHKSAFQRSILLLPCAVQQMQCSTGYPGDKPRTTQQLIYQHNNYLPYKGDFKSQIIHVMQLDSPLPACS